MQISTLIGKRIFSREGNELGYVLSVLLTKNRTKLFALGCADGEENEFYLPARAVLSVGDAVVCNDQRAEIIESQGQNATFGLAVYSERGESLGTVYDLSLESDGAYLILNDGSRFSAARARFGNVVILRSEPSARKRAAQTPHKKSAACAVNTAAKEKTPSESEFNRLNLLGRRVRKTVFDSEGNVVAHTGDLITPDTLAQARRHNHLLQLTVNTLTNLPL